MLGVLVKNCHISEMTGWRIRQETKHSSAYAWSECSLFSVFGGTQDKHHDWKALGIHPGKPSGNKRKKRKDKNEEEEKEYFVHILKELLKRRRRNIIYTY